MDLSRIVFNCMIPTFYQGILFSFPLLLSGLVLRLLIRIWTQINVNILASLFGVWVLWWYYNGAVVYFIILLVIVYLELVLFPYHRGMIIGLTSVIFIMTWLGLFNSVSCVFCL